MASAERVMAIRTVREFFAYYPEMDKSECMVDNCRRMLKGKHAGNLERHVVRFHPNEAAALQLAKEGQKRSHSPPPAVTPHKRPKTGIVHIEMDEATLKKACCEVVIDSGRGFAALEDPGLRLIIDPIVRSLNSLSPGKTIAINRKSIRLEIQQKAAELRAAIREDISGRLICLKIDTATHLDRHLLSVNVQFIKGGKLVVRNLCMKELLSSHTAQSLKAEIAEVLRQFGVQSQNIYSCTIDSAANIAKAVKYLQEVTSFSTEESGSSGQTMPTLSDVSVTNPNSPEALLDLISEDDDAEEDDAEDDDAEDDEAENDEFGDSWTPPAPGINIPIITDALSKMNVSGVQCAAHALQLAVGVAIRGQSDMQPTVAKARQLCKCLHTPIIAGDLKNLKRRRPLLGVLTHWYSLHDMLVSLLSLRDVCEELAKPVEERRPEGGWRCRRQHSKLLISNLQGSEWQLVEDFCNSLNPAKCATKVFQGAQLTAGSFYEVWLRCKIDTMKIQSPLAKMLVETMNKHEGMLMGTSIMSAGIFMDPRYRVALTREDTAAAEAHLKALWMRLENIVPSSSTTNIVRSNGGTPAHTRESMYDDDDDIELLLRDYEMEKEDLYANSPALDISQIITQYTKWPRISRTENILQFWETRKNTDPELYTLAMTALAIPVTHVTADRMSSNLLQLLPIFRYNLSADTINDILLIKCNNVLAQP